jgi:hypothetical protein
VTVSTRALAAVAIVLAACDAGGAYLYTGHEYEPQRDCVTDLLALDVLEGTDPGASCSPLCLAGKDFDGAVQVYASTMCGPPPPGADVSGSDPDCKPALAALARGDFCLDGGGSTNPLDGGAD